MKDKLIYKMLIMIMLVFCTVNILTNSVYAEDFFDITYYDQDSSDNITNSVDTIAGAILSVVRIIGTGVAIIMLTVIAIKYMSAAPGERAEIKKSSIQYAVGAVILFGAVAILTIIQNFMGTIFS